MATTKYSHAFLVGSFNGKITPQELDKDWERVNNQEEYEWICSIYYKGHVDAMLDVNDSRPAFLKDVCHYKLTFDEVDDNGEKSVGKKIEMKMKKNMGKDEFIYCFRLLNLHLFFFPYNIVLLAIEIDDTGTDLNELTAAHSAMTQSGTYTRNEIKFAFSSITRFLSNPPSILGVGNKFKLYQVIEIDSEKIEDRMLYEIGTSSPIGCVGTRHPLAPSEQYYDNIMRLNTVSAFNDWKGLALMDSFTMISNAEKSDDWTWDEHFYLWNNHYFQLIYLRCLFEKTFCFSQNIAYRMGESTPDLSKMISDMERYYFYNKISYNFLPNLLYESMSKGMELQDEREELAKQIKERAKEEETIIKEHEIATAQRLKEQQDEQKERDEKRFNNILAYVSIFAVFSVIWDICSILMASSYKLKESVWTARTLFVIGIALSLFFIWLIKYNSRRRNETK